jgi:uncharacterized phage-associated protein
MAVSFQFNRTKAVAALLFLASQQPKRIQNFDRYKAAKLLFLADKFHLVRYGRPISGDYYKALQWGPIPQTILDALSELESGNVGSQTGQEVSRVLEFKQLSGHEHPCLTPKVKLDEGDLSESDLETLNYVADCYGQFTFDQLYQLTHKTPEYQKAWDKRGGALAVTMDFQDFFQADPKANQAVLQELVEDDRLRKALTDW